MLRIFKKNKKKEKESPAILDLNEVPIEIGAKVNCLRYELGECIVELVGREYFYVSIKTGEKVSYTKMFDASTKNQKVEVIED